jgi:phosphomevalonate kinase
MRLAATAPGKLVLLGEYSVLFGEPSVVTTVDRRASVTLSPATSGDFSIVSPGLVDEPSRFTVSADGKIRWTDNDGIASQRLALVERLLAAWERTDLVSAASMQPFDAVLDTREFYERTDRGAVKLGIGSSAALTVAFASALASWSGQDAVLDPAISWLGRLLDFHREFQHGRGSGIDLAASVLGGVLEYRLDDERRVAEASPLTLPADLRMLFVWTCRSADTGEFLEKLSSRMVEDGGSSERALRRLGDVARAGVTALREGRTGSFLESVDQFCEAMEALGEVVGLPILSEEHEDLRLLANRCGVHYKPSGAGGGDIGVAFSDNVRALETLALEVKQLGFRAIPFATDPAGFEIHRSKA